jgi:hypothetical protein
MVAIRTSDTSVYFYETAQRHILSCSTSPPWASNVSLVCLGNYDECSAERRRYLSQSDLRYLLEQGPSTKALSYPFLCVKAPTYAMRSIKSFARLQNSADMYAHSCYSERAVCSGTHRISNSRYNSVGQKPWKVTVGHVVKKFPAFYATQRISKITVFEIFCYWALFWNTLIKSRLFSSSF